MSNSEKFFKTLSSLIENGILTSKDIKREISTNFKFKRDALINKLRVVPREEFEILKKLVHKQEVAIKKLSKKKILKGQRNLNLKSLVFTHSSWMFPPCELIISSTMAKPKPTPDLFKLLLLSSLKKGLNTFL